MKKKDVREWFDQQPSIKYLHGPNKKGKSDHINGRPLISHGPDQKKSKKSKSSRTLRSADSGRSIFSNGDAVFGECPNDITDNDLDEMLIDFPHKVKKWSIDDVRA